MIFWDINTLKIKIINNELSELDYFLYFFISFIMISCVILVENIDKGEFWSCIIGVIASGFLLPLACFLINKHYKIHHFIEKYFAINFVASIRLLLVFLLPMIIVAIIDSEPPDPYIDIGLTIFLQSVTCGYIVKHYRDLCRQYAASKANQE